MIGNKALIDTNAYSELLRGNEIVLEALSQAKVVFLSIFVLGELYAGFKGGRREYENRRLLEKFADRPSVQLLNADSETSDIFGNIKALLKSNGTPIPINDVWIAAHTFQTGSELITFDEHFKQIPGLRMWGFI